MGKNLKLLEVLQAIDLKLDAWHSEKQGFLKEIEACEEKVKTAQSAVSVKQAELNDIEEEKRRLEENLAAETDNIARSEVRLKDIKTQKEYQAVSKEITAAKKIKTELEEQLLRNIARFEELKAEIDAMEENLRLLAENSSVLKSEIQEKIDKLEGGMNLDIAERETVVKDIQPSLLNRYVMLRERRQGVAVVEARNGSCLGCNMNLPPQVYNDLFKTENLITCPHCQRMLYLRQQDN